MTCAISTCKRSPARRGWCNRHYRRWLKHGDPETVKKAPNGTYEGCFVDECERAHHAKGYCNVHYGRVKHHGDPLAGQRFRSVSDDPLERIAHYSEPQPDGCVYWTGPLQPNGYGYLSFANVRVMAHVFAYTQQVGPVPDGLDLDHQCHNRDRSCPGGWDCPHRRCINVKHLEPATRSENMLRGLNRTGPR